MFLSSYTPFLSAIRTFFNWFYFAINVGAVMSFTGIAYIQQQISFTWGLIIPGITLFLSAVVFAVGSSIYKKFPPGGSIIGPAFAIIMQAFRAPWDDRMNAKTFLDRAKPSRKANGESGLLRAKWRT